MTRRVGILLFDDVEVLDFSGPLEVFSVASRLRRRRQPDAPLPFKVFTVAQTTQPVHARGGLRVLPGADLRAHPPIDVLVVPGGVVDAALRNDELLAWIRTVSGDAQLTASVCTGAFLLARAGVLEGKRATTHWEDVAEFRSLFPQVALQTDVRWTQDGKVFTSAGISAGIDLSLHLVGYLEDVELARHTAKQMEYDWHPAN